MIATDSRTRRRHRRGFGALGYTVQYYKDSPPGPEALKVMALMGNDYELIDRPVAPVAPDEPNWDNYIPSTNPSMGAPVDYTPQAVDINVSNTDAALAKYNADREDYLQKLQTYSAAVSNYVSQGNAPSEIPFENASTAKQQIVADAQQARIDSIQGNNSNNNQTAIIPNGGNTTTQIAPTNTINNTPPTVFSWDWWKNLLGLGTTTTAITTTQGSNQGGVNNPTTPTVTTQMLQTDTGYLPPNDFLSQLANTLDPRNYVSDIANSTPDTWWIPGVPNWVTIGVPLGVLGFMVINSGSGDMGVSSMTVRRRVR